MEFHVDNFIIETVAKNKNKKDFTLFKGFHMYVGGEPHLITNNIFTMIDIIEIMKAYAGMRMDKHTSYNLSKNIEAKVVEKKEEDDKAKVVEKEDDKVKSKFYLRLKIHFLSQTVRVGEVFDVDETIYLDRVQTILLSAKFAKVLQRCEAWQG